MYIYRYLILALVAFFFPLLIASAQIVAIGDFETGDFSQWRAVLSGGQIDIETNIVRQGNYATRMMDI